jgi:hypothetical protein
MARRSPIDIDARRHAAREIAIQRRYRSDDGAADLLQMSADALAREAANLLLAGRTPEARRYARAHQLVVESRSRLVARRQSDRDAKLEREAAEHGIQVGETVRVVRQGAGNDWAPVGTTVVVDHVRGHMLYTGNGRETRILWGADVERVTGCGHLRCKQMPGGCEMYDAPRTITATPAGRDRHGNPLAPRSYVIDRRPEPFGEGTVRIFSENRTLPKVRGDGFEFTPDVVLADSVIDAHDENGGDDQ